MQQLIAQNFVLKS